MSPRISEVRHPAPQPVPTPTGVPKSSPGASTGRTGALQPPAGIQDSAPSVGWPFTIFQDAFNRLIRLEQHLNTATRGIGEIAKADRAAGKDTISGARAYGNITSEIFDRLSTQAKKDGVNLEAVASDPINQLGGLAQKVLLGDAKEEVFTELMQQLDLDPQKFDLGKFISGDWDSMRIGEAAGNVAATASAAESAAQAAGTAGSAGTAGVAADLLGAGGSDITKKVIGGIGAAYSIYNLFKGWGKGNAVQGATNGFAAGAYIGSYFSPLGSLIGGAIGGVVGFIGGLFKTGKSKDQLARDQVRKMMLQNGMIDENWTIALAGGARYDIGKDGGFRLQNVDGTNRRAYEVDFKNPLAGEAVGWVQPLAAILCAGDKKLGSQFAGYFANAVLSNTTDREGARANALALLQSFNVEPKAVLAGIVELVKSHKITEEVGAAYANGIVSLFDPASRPPAAEAAAENSVPQPANEDPAAQAAQAA